MNSSPATKLRLMCSHGGQILPRPHDKTLSYIGGETHILTIDRHTTIPTLTARISKTLIKSSSTTSFSIKYQLPNEDLDSLITITNDEDLENMIDEYDRLENLDHAKRIRVFVFPVTRVGSDSGSLVNCLLGLDGDSVDTTSSSFGSGSEIGQLVMPAAPVVSSSSTRPGFENLDPFLLYHDRLEQGLQVQQQKKESAGFDFTSPDSVLRDCTISDPLSPVTPVVVQSLSKDILAADINDTQKTRIEVQQQQIHNSAYLLSMPTTQVDTQRPQLHQQQQLQYIQPLQYIHPNQPFGAVPVTPYYQQYPHQPPTNQQNFVYYMPTRQPPQGYNYPLQQPQPSHTDAQPVAATPNNQTDPKSGFLAGPYRTNSGGPQLVRVLSGRQNQNQYVWVLRDSSPISASI